MKKVQLSPSARLGQMKSDAAAFFRRHHRLDLYSHAESVLELAIANNVVEPNKMVNGEDPNSLNERLAMLILCHPMEIIGSKKHMNVFNSKVGSGRVYSSKLEDELRTFCRLRELDTYTERGILPRYAEILNKPKLALLARIVDLAMLHDPTVTPVALASDDSGLFYRHPGELEETRKIIAGNALRVYAPFAEMFGYRYLLNRIREIAYFELDREYVEEVTAKIEAVREKVERTKEFVRGLLEELDRRLTADGIKHTIMMRSEKSLGSILEKLKRRPELKCDVEKLHDLVAFKVVTETERETYAAMRILTEILADMKKEVRGAPYYTEKRDYIEVPKPNGYRSVHCDNISYDKTEFVDFEAIFRTKQMEDEATNGMYAHHIYKGDADLHGRKSLLTYARYIEALSDPAIFDKIALPAKGVPIHFTAQIRHLGGGIIALPLTAYSGDTWLDVIALALKQLETERGVPVDTTRFHIPTTARLHLGREIGVPENRELVLALGGTPPVFGETARNLMRVTTTVEGATLAFKLAKLKLR